MKTEEEQKMADFLEVVFMHLVSQDVMTNGVSLAQAKESVQGFMESDMFLEGLKQAKYDYLTQNN